MKLAKKENPKLYANYAKSKKKYLKYKQLIQKKYGKMTLPQARQKK